MDVTGSEGSGTRRADTAAGGGGAGGVTRGLLGCGALAGPVYLVVGLVQAFTRPGFDITRHDLSLLSNGGLGWIQVGNFIVTGLLVVAGAMGLRRALREGRARTWGPLLVGVYGLGLIGAGIFVADPAAGFPPGTPADAHAISWHGLMHLAAGAIGFLALIVACLLFARRFAGRGETAWSVFSAIAGVVFLAGFFGIASGSGSTATVLGFWAALALVWSWLSALSVRLTIEEGR